jgi:hypothetical protein
METGTLKLACAAPLNGFVYLVNGLHPCTFALSCSALDRIGLNALGHACRAMSVREGTPV